MMKTVKDFKDAGLVFVEGDKYIDSAGDDVVAIESVS